MQTLESKLASAEKDVTRLTKALERSDKYIEDLEKKRDESTGSAGLKASSSKGSSYAMNSDILSRKPGLDASRGDSASRQLFSEENGGKSSSGERSKYYFDRNGDDKGSDLRNEYTDFESDKRLIKGHSTKADGTNGGKKRVTFDLNKNTDTTAVSFELEMPSPVKMQGNRNSAPNRSASPVKGVLKKGNDRQVSLSNNKDYDRYASDLSKATDEDSLSGSYDQRSVDRYSKDDDLLHRKVTHEQGDRKYDEAHNGYSRNRKKYSADDSVLSQPSDLEPKVFDDMDRLKKQTGQTQERRSDDLDYRVGQSVRSRGRDEEIDISELDDTNYIESELDELNISLTPEFTDCMKLLNRAEKKVQGGSDLNFDDNPTSFKSGRDSDTDAVFRASTGSIGYRGETGEDYMSSYKADTDRFAASLDNYSRGKHVRSGSLDNIFLASDRKTDFGNEFNQRPSSALPTASNMYPPTSQSKYSTGLTTGRTTLTRTPSVDNLLLTRPAVYQNKYASSLSFRPGLVPSYKSYSESDDKLDVKGNGLSTVGNSSTQPFPGKHGMIGSNGGGLDRDRVDTNGRVSFDAVLQARAKSLSDYDNSVNKDRLERENKKAFSSGRYTPTVTGSSSGSDFDMKYTSGRELASEYTSRNGMGSGRSTPTLAPNSDISSNTKSNTQFTDYKYMGNDMTLKPPSGSRHSDIGSNQLGSSRMTNTATFDNLTPHTIAYSSSALSSNADTAKSISNYSLANPSTNGDGGIGSSSSLGGIGGGVYYDGTKYEGKPFSMSSSNKISLSSNNFDLMNGRMEVDASISNNRMSNLDDKKYLSSNSGSSSGSVSAYNDFNYRDGTDFSNFSTKVAASSLPMPSQSAGSNPSSGSFAGSAYGLGSSASSSSYASSSYLPTTLTSVTSVPSYSTALSVPFTYTSTSYTSSGPTNLYTSKPLDPIVESSNHYSYVSNASGDFPSKNDTFALPEPKKRLFDNSEDLDMSVSPIKSNRRF